MLRPERVVSVARGRRARASTTLPPPRPKWSTRATASCCYARAGRWRTDRAVRGAMRGANVQRAARGRAKHGDPGLGARRHGADRRKRELEMARNTHQRGRAAGGTNGWSGWQLFGLGSPAILLILVILVIPVGWLFYVSFHRRRRHFLAGKLRADAQAQVLCPHLPDHVRGQLADHRPVHPDRLSAGLFHVAAAEPDGQPVPDHGAVAVLDLAAGAHLCLAGAAAKAAGW